MTDLNKILDIKPNNIKPSQGKVLISEPFMYDYYFKRAVILLAEYNEEGAFGIVLNKLLHSKLNDIINGFPPFDADLYVGGPVSTDKLFYIHKFGDIVPDSTEIADGIYWGGDVEVIKELIAVNKITNNDIRFFIGYSGWTANQLEEELENNSWVVTRTNVKAVLKTKAEQVWNNIVLSLGEDYAHWVNFPVDPNLN
ncbi:MAG: YqgE/AlgH family protein [Bacteroidota bacterium]